jgi:hypothetical protein
MGIVIKNPKEDEIDMRGKCMICAEREADAFWACYGDIKVCYWCAIDVLPKLIADATVASMHPTKKNALNFAFNKVRSEFYYAAAIALERKR